MEQQAMDENSTDKFPFIKEMVAMTYKDVLQDAELKTLRDHILRAAKRRDVALSEEQQQRIGTCKDQQTLDRWFDNVLDATVADDIFR